MGFYFAGRGGHCSVQRRVIYSEFIFKDYSVRKGEKDSTAEVQVRHDLVLILGHGGRDVKRRVDVTEVTSANWTS